MHNIAHKKIFVCLFAATLLCWLPSAPALAGLDAPHNHNAASSLGCLSCHDVTSSLPKLMPPWTAHPQANIDDTPLNAMCWSCHNGVDAPFAQTHSSLSTGDKYGDWTVECWVCHSLHSQEQLRKYGAAGYVYSEASTGVTETTLAKTGAGWEEDEFKGMLLVPNTANVGYNYTITANTADTLTVRGPMDLSKAAAGNTFGIVLGKLIRSTINLGLITAPLHPEDKTGYKAVRLFRRDGANSFADGNATYDGICEVCHSETKHFQNDGGGSDPEHDNIDPVAGSNCINCHSHANGFAHGGGAGTGCVECHGHDANSPYDATMTGSGPFAGESMGAGTFQSHSTHTETVADDLKGPGIYCNSCHNINKFPLFRSVADPNAELSLAETDVCDACHSESGTYDGLDDPVVGAKTIWRTGAYVSTSDSTLRSGKEKWCATCHDEDASIIAGVLAPNVIGDEDGANNYGTGWGFYKTGHGVPNAETIPASGGAKDGPDKGCADCHDLATAHIDGNSRTFDCDNSSGGACSASYQSGYRLKSVNGEVPMEMPYTGRNLESFRLCFSCHANTDDWLAPDLEYRDKTNFYDFGRATERNLHIYHLRWSQGSELDWDAGFEENMSCITCHNVHGSRNIAMIRSGELTELPSMSARYGNDCSTHTAGQVEPVPNDVTLAISTKSTMLGNLAGSYCSHCHGTGSGIITVLRSPTAVANRAPALDWVGYPGYETDGANPDAATSGATFTFRVEYSDINQDGPPDIIQLWIDRNDDGSYTDNADPALDEKIEMTSSFVEPDTCAPYSTGVDYVVTVILAKVTVAGSDTLTYRFHAEFGGVEATGPATGEGTLTLLNDGPVLAWTGEPDFTVDGVNPDYGAQGGTYTFRVNYVDDDNDPCPASASSDIQVWIDLDHSSSYDAGEMFNLTEVAPGDTDCTTGGGGKLYSTDQSLANGGTYNYRFYGTDGSDVATGAPVVPGGTVTVTGSGGNNPPLLAWDSGACRPEGAMPPRSALNSTINFSVRYFDEDNQCPTGGAVGDIQVYVDLDNSGSYSGGERINLDPVDADADCTTAGGGKLYTVAVTPTTAAAGIAYKFHATDGTDEALGAPRTAGGTADVINASKVVRQDGSEDYTTISGAISGTGSGAVILVYDGTYTESLAWPQWQSRHLYSACGAEATIISHSNNPVIYFNHSGVSTLDGFTITGGSGRGIYSAGTNFDGSQSRPTIKDCIIRNNSGSGVATSYSNATITGCEIYGNSGGGVDVVGYTAIADTTIHDNSTSGDGGGIHGGRLSLTDVAIKGNTAAGNGGGIYGNAGSTHPSSTYEKITLSGNTAGNTGGGGYFTYGTPTISNSLVSDNAAPTGGGIGVGIWAGVQFRNSSIVNNIASTGNGGAFYSSDGAVNLANSIAWGNRATSGSGHIGYFSGNSKTIYLYDSILENNGDDNITDDKYFVAINNSQVNDTGTNYDADPNFVDASNVDITLRDYHLNSPSIAIDNAADNSGLGIPADDLEGNSRPPGSEDIGAYEYLP